MKAKNNLFSPLSLMVGTSIAIMAINKYIKLSATSKNITAESRSLCYKWRFGNIHYTKDGSGQPLLLVHDLSPFSSSFEWSQLIHYLKERYTVYTIDILGCGHSEKPDLIYTNYLYVQLLSDFIKSEIGHRTNIISTGASSSFIIMACNQTPELFDKIMLINPDSLLACSQIPNRHSKFYRLILNFPVIGTLLYHIASGKQFLANDFAQNHYSNPYSIKPAYLDVYYESAHMGKSPKSLYASVKCSYTKCNVLNALKKIDNSIYIVGGMEVSSIKQIIREYHDINPAIESSLIPKTKHLPQLESPKELLNIVQFFFTTNHTS